MGIIERMAKAQSATVEAYVRQIVQLEAERDMWKNSYQRTKAELNKEREYAAHLQQQPLVKVEQKAG